MASTLDTASAAVAPQDSEAARRARQRTASEAWIESDFYVRSRRAAVFNASVVRARLANLCLPRSSAQVLEYRTQNMPFPPSTMPSNTIPPWTGEDESNVSPSPAIGDADGATPMDTPVSATVSAARLTAAAGADTFAPTPRIPAFDFVTAPATNILAGVAVVFSGTDFARFTAVFLRQAIERHGGVVVDHVTASGSAPQATHVIFGGDNNNVIAAANAAGLPVLTESWIYDSIAYGALVDAGLYGLHSQPLAGLCFYLAGSGFSHDPRYLSSLIAYHGGSVAPVMTMEVTHILISPSTSHAECEVGYERGLPVVMESFVHTIIKQRSPVPDALFCVPESAFSTQMDPGAIALSDVPPKLGRAPPVTGSRLVIATSQEWVEKEQVSYVEVEDNTPVVDSDEGEKKDEGDIDNDVEADMGVDVVESASSERSPSPPLSRHIEGLAGGRSERLPTSLRPQAWYDLQHADKAPPGEKGFFCVVGNCRRLIKAQKSNLRVHVGSHHRNEEWRPLYKAYAPFDTESAMPIPFNTQVGRVNSEVSKPVALPPNAGMNALCNALRKQFANKVAKAKVAEMLAKGADSANPAVAIEINPVGLGATVEAASAGEAAAVSTASAAVAAAAAGPAVEFWEKPWESTATVVFETNKSLACDVVNCQLPALPCKAVKCSKCSRRYHAACNELSATILKTIEDINLWHCGACKTCEVCDDGSEENDRFMLFCDICDRGFHTYCLRPPLESPPEGEWGCPICQAQHRRRRGTAADDASGAQS